MCNCAGIPARLVTGFITELTFRVMPLEYLDVISVACPDPRKLQQAIQKVVDSELPLWSFISSRPADRRTWEAGMRMRATAMVRMNSKGSRSASSA